MNRISNKNINSRKRKQEMTNKTWLLLLYKPRYSSWKTWRSELFHLTNKSDSEIKELCKYWLKKQIEKYQKNDFESYKSYNFKILQFEKCSEALKWISYSKKESKVTIISCRVFDPKDLEECQIGDITRNLDTEATCEVLDFYKPKNLIALKRLLPYKESRKLQAKHYTHHSFSQLHPPEDVFRLDCDNYKKSENKTIEDRFQKLKQDNLRELKKDMQWK